MKRLQMLLRRSELHVLLFCLCLVLFTRPLLVMSSTERPLTVLRSLYLPWAIVIALLFIVVTNSTAPAAEGRGDEKNGGMRDV